METDYAMRSRLLVVDAIINLLLGIPLMLAPRSTASLLGLPHPASGFYAGILGAVLTGIGLALLLQVIGKQTPMEGLGLEGAICINVLGAGVLVVLLLFGNIEMERHGRVFLWSVATLVLLLSGLEFLMQRGSKNQDKSP